MCLRSLGLLSATLALVLSGCDGVSGNAPADAGGGQDVGADVADSGGLTDVAGPDVSVGDADVGSSIVDVTDAGVDAAPSDAESDAVDATDGEVAPDAVPGADADAAEADTTDTGPPIQYTACSDCETEDDCRDEPCENESEVCSVAPYCEMYQGECTCEGGKWSCTATDCPPCDGPAPPCCVDGETVDATCTGWEWECVTGTPGACSGVCSGEPPTDLPWCLVSCEGRALLSPVCTPEQGWHCPAEAIDPATCCASPTVHTVDGCLTCQQTMAAVGAAIDAAQATYGACVHDEDCTAVFADTKCQGACQVGVSKEGEPAFVSALEATSEAYCQDYTAECGYATPGCAPVNPVCKEGTCALEVGIP